MPFCSFSNFPHLYSSVKNFHHNSHFQCALLWEDKEGRPGRFAFHSVFAPPKVFGPPPKSICPTKKHLAHPPKSIRLTKVFPQKIYLLGSRDQKLGAWCPRDLSSIATRKPPLNTCNIHIR